MEPETIKINEVEYVRKDSVNKMAEKVAGMDYLIVRTQTAGVFAGYLKSRDGKEAVVISARRLWYWAGAASLSQLSVDGVSKPQNCKFPCEVASVTLTDVIELLPCTEKAQKSIKGVAIWKQ